MGGWNDVPPLDRRYSWGPMGVTNRVPPAAFVIGFRQHRSGLSIPVGNGVV